MVISRQVWRSYAALLPMLCMAIAFWIGSQQSIWFDEAYSILLSKESITSLVSLAAVDAHPPLYYLYLKGWAALFGYGEASLRLSSIVPFGVSILGMLFILRQFYSRKIAIFASLILLVAPFLLRYSFEIRMYAAVIAIGVWSTYVLIRARTTNDKWWWIVYMILVTMSLYTLYMSAVFWVWHVMWVLVEDRKKLFTHPVSQQWFAYGGAMVLFMPWLPTLYDQLKHNVLPPEVTAVTIDQISNVFAMYLAYLPRYDAGAWTSILIVAIGVLIVYIIVKLWPSLSRTEKSGYRLLYLGWVSSLIFFIVISLPPQPPRFMERYMVLAAMMFYLTLGLTTALAVRSITQRLLGGILIAVLLVVCGMGMNTLAQRGNFNFQRMQRPYGKQLMANINGCHDAVIVTKSPYEYIDLSYYLSQCEVRFFQQYDLDYRGGYALLHNTTYGITSLDQVDVKRIIVVDADENTLNRPYKLVDQYIIENAVVQEYTR